MLKAALLAAAALWPAGAHALQFPLSANDLGVKERFLTGNHGGGGQDDGKDIVGRRFKGGTSWTTLVSDNADKTKNSSYVAYGKPIYAMAPGTVIKCWRNAPENPVVGQRHPELGKGISGGGNHLWVRDADGVDTLYAHMIPGSVPTALCPHNAELLTKPSDINVANGAKIAAGQMLGRIGNSGSSGSPHLHVHMQKGGKAVKMPFDRGLTTSYAGESASFNGPWARIDGAVLADAPLLVWAPRKVGSYTWKGTPDEEYQGLFDHMADSRMMPKWITCADNGQSYSAEWMPASGQWRSHHGMTAAVAAEKQALYTGQGYKRTSSYTCGSRQVAVWRK